MARELYYEIDEKGTGYYIKERGNELFKIYQYPPFIPYSGKNIEESAQKHIDAILKADAEAEKERVTLESLQKELDITKMAIDELMMMTMEGGMM